MYKFLISFAFIFFFQGSVFAQNTILETKVSNITEFNEAVKKAVPGTKIILKNGEWKDVHLKAFGNGTKEAPIVISAETNGEVIVTGDSRLNISGNYVIVAGLWFKDGAPTASNIIEFRKDSKEFATNCRLTNCAITNYNPVDGSIENRWVNLWGKNNRVDHCNFTGKTNAGTTLVVWLKGEEHTENDHQIDHNFFGHRPDLGENGGETIRIGTSENSMKSSKTIVEFNTFKHCNGEIEIISNKSNDNVFRNNLFMESEGTLTLRHGNNALVENNVFIGNNKSKAGGIRIINEGHIVRNNLLVGIIGDDFRGPIVVMNGVPNSPLNRYNQVKNIDIQNNTLVNCSAIQFGAGKDNERTLAPIHVNFANNLITNTTGTEILNVQDVVTGFTFNGNIVDSEAEVNPSQFTKATLDWAVLKGIPMPTSANEILKSAVKTAKSPDLDMTDAKRDIYVAGAFNLDNTYYPAVINAKSGPFWNVVIEQKETTTAKLPSEIVVEPGTETINKALKQAGKKATLMLNPGLYIVEKSMKINGDIVIKGNNKNGEVIVKMSETIENPLTYFFRAEEGTRLQLENLTIDGAGKTAVKYALVSPDENMTGPYNLFIDNCIIQNFTNTDGGSVFKAYVGTFADTLSIKNSIIRDSYRGLNLSYEKDFGKYNAEEIILYNTLFQDLKEFAVNYIRNGDNPMTKGGKLAVDHCVFSDIYNVEKGYILRTKGIKAVDIQNSVFENCQNIVTSFNLSGINNNINNCLFYSSGTLKTTSGAKSTNLLFKSPKWEDRNTYLPSEKSPLLKENNEIAKIGLLNPIKN